ncbi:MAG: ATP synthase F1 subunit gamma [Patescibacteria group bacterium]|jgi:F-type H+-transporting ATPase subunit gamma
MSQAKEIKKRIKSISSTKKITKAMEMVAAAKMRRAVEAVIKTRAYAKIGWGVAINIAEAVGSDKLIHPLLEKKTKTEKVVIVLIASNRGLCGGFNTAVVNKAVQSIKTHNDLPTDFILVGKRGDLVRRRFAYPVIAEFPKNDLKPSAVEVSPIAKIIIDDYLAGKYDKVLIAYTDFINPSQQVPRVRQLLPIELEGTDKYLAGAEGGRVQETEADRLKRRAKKNHSFIYEPNDSEVLDYLLPRLIELQLYQGLLESNAAEHSARMSAMSQASRAAEDIIDELTRFYNKARQALITAEIAEISSGASSVQN